MLYERLEVIRRAANGDIYRRITCLAGRVTVLRSRDDAEVEMYDEVLRCTREIERFSVLLDGRPFNVEQQLRVSCAEDPLASSALSLWQFLKDHGFPGDRISARLEEVGLGGLEYAPIRELTSQQRRVLFIVHATEVSDRVIVLHDPFLGVPTPYAEVLARRFAESAWKHSTIAVVTKLTARPEAWVENEHITRVQLERPRDRTIGFGGGELSSSEFIQAFREQLRQADSAVIAPEKRQLLADTATVRMAPPSGPTGETVEETPKRQSPGVLTGVRRPKITLEIPSHRMLAALGAGFAAALSLLLLTRSGETPTAPVRVAPPPAAPASPAAAVVPHDAPKLPPPLPLIPPVAPAEMPRRAISLLDAYPPAIHQAVMKAFYQPQSVLKELPSVSYNQPQKPKTEVPPAQRDIAPPEPARDAPPLPPDSATSSFASGSPRTPEELQAQRELLRRAFVDAVMRARERQMQMQYGDTGYPQ